MTDWISVEDRLPPSGERILIYWTHRGKHVPDIIDYESDAFELLQSVTHWAPITPPGTAPAPAGDARYRLQVWHYRGWEDTGENYGSISHAVNAAMASEFEKYYHWRVIDEDGKLHCASPDAPAGDALAGEALGEKLIAWAADGEKTLSHDEYNAWCVFCGVPRQFNPKPHKVNCLHKRAQALQGKKNDVGDNQ